VAKGDHIRVRRMRGLYCHHGIDMGDGTVIHFSGEPMQRKPARVARITEELFLEGEEKHVVEYGPDEGLLPVEETLLLAEEQLDKGGYSLLYNNCEHFATYCKTRKKKSRQVRSMARKVVVFAGTATAVVFVILTKQSGKRGA
jgi:hypothetical protein